MKMAKHYWSSHVAAVQAQAITTRAYAKRHGLALSTLYYWQRKVQSATTDCANSEGVAASRHPSKFVALAVTVSEPDYAVPQPATGCTLVLAGGMRLEMPALPDPQWLAALGRSAQGAH